MLPGKLLTKAIKQNGKIKCGPYYPCGGGQAMYVYIQSEPHLWTVGFYAPDGEWMPESDHASKEDAAARVRWLNGGRVAEQPTHPGAEGAKP